MTQHLPIRGFSSGKIKLLFIKLIHLLVINLQALYFNTIHQQVIQDTFFVKTLWSNDICDKVVYDSFIISL